MIAKVLSLMSWLAAVPILVGVALWVVHLSPPNGINSSYFARSRLVRAWVPSSNEQYEEAEQKMLEKSGVPFQRMMVRTPHFNINTIVVEKRSTRERQARLLQEQSAERSQERSVVQSESKDNEKEDPVMLLVHGFGGGAGLWSKNLAALSEHYKLYAIDLAGFGKSSTPDFNNKSSEETTSIWVQSVEEWRQAVGLQKMSILAHSLGAYVSGAYTLSHPQHVSRLTLVAPFGVEASMGRMGEFMKRRPEDGWGRKLLKSLLYRYTPQDLLLAAGPFGPSLIRNFRGRYDESRYLYGDNIVGNYLYHTSALPAGSGDRGFIQLLDRDSYSLKTPLAKTLPLLEETVPVSLIYGEVDSIVPPSWDTIRQAVKGPCDTYVIRDSSHHPYATHEEHFHHAVLHHLHDDAKQQQRSFSHPHIHFNPYERHYHHHTAVVSSEQDGSARNRRATAAQTSQVAADLRALADV